MKREEVLESLEELSDKHIKEAEKPPKKRTFLKVAVAAVLVIAIGINMMSAPMLITADAIAVASEPRITKRPDLDDYTTREEWNADLKKWNLEVGARVASAAQAKINLNSFFKEGNTQFLQTEGNKNKLWSPINAYIGLAMTAELTEGETRQQILDLFGVEDTETLRKQVSAVWESVYQNNSNEICVLANSLWLEDGLQYNQEAMDALAYYYYASVYQGDLGSDRINKDIAAWINNNTGKFLKDSTKNIQLSQDIIMALYSTLYFQAKWTDEFSASNNTQDVFHTLDGDTQATFMNKKLTQMYYYWGETFGAVNLTLKNGCHMWFILPDEDKTVDDVLSDDSYMEMISDLNWKNNKYMKVNLSVPKFDVASTTDLSNGFKNMGVTKVFQEVEAEFTKLTGDLPIYLTEANQSVRVQIDEQGVKAAVYFEIPGAGAAQPPEEIIDFVLDRPFLFVITNDNIPLFAGCVNNP
ncbi:MAG: serpin family protein [Lachnospiraceae bacterium]|nr:serpin family protein [Lachnospiraceae bacterium]